MRYVSAVNLLAIVIAIATVPSARAANICDSDNLRRLKDKNGVYSSSNELFSAVGSQSVLHIFGEAHFYTDKILIKRVVSELAPRMPGQKKCMFLEIPKAGLEKFAKKFEEYRQRPNLSRAKRNQIEDLSTYYPNFVQAAKENGLQIFEIDHPDHIEDSKSVVERNDVMAENAHRLLTDQTCDSAIFFVGKAHITPIENHPSLVSLIKASGLNPITYNLVDSAEQSDIQMSSWGGRLSCSPRDVLPSAFSNSTLTPKTRLLPIMRTERSPTWNDFDFSIAR